MSDRLRIRQGGEGEPILLLLHGLGATSDVWHGLENVLRTDWPGRWIAPDLPGHGGSEPLTTYSFGHLAAALTAAVPATDRLAILGHSLGGVLGLTLASGWFGVRVGAVCGLGIKVSWTDEELTRARALATRPNPTFATRSEAAERHLKVAGLVGLMPPDAVSDAAVVPAGEGWTTAFDPRAFAVGAPDMRGLLDAARGAVTLAAGERDPMSPEPELRKLVAEPVILPGAGHNVQVERPELLGPLLGRLSV